MSGVTLDELCVEVGVTLAQLNKPCSSEHIQDIALFLESWRNVAPRLGLSDAEVEAAKINAHSEEERRQKILATWKAKFAFKAKYRVLVEALLKIGRADQAEEVCRVLVPQQPIEDHPTCPPEATAITPPPPSSSMLDPLSTQSEGVSPPIPAENLQNRHFTAVGSPSALPTDQLAQTSTKGVRMLQQEKHRAPSNTEAKMMIPVQPEHVAIRAPSSAQLAEPEQLVHTSAKQQREVRQEIDTLKSMYDALLMKTVESFKEKHTGTPTFLSKLRTSVAILPSSLKDEHIHFLRERSSEIAKATSVDELFIIVSCYSDFYNCSLVVYIVERFGDDMLRQDLQNYTKEFEAFCSRTILSDFVAALTGSPEIPPDFLKLVLKLGPQWELRSLKDLEEFHKTLKGRSFLASHAVRLMGGETGSIFLIWSVPRTCSSFLISSLDPQFLQQYHIARVTIDGEDLEQYRWKHRLLDLHAVSSKYVNEFSEGLVWASGEGCLEDVVFLLSTGVGVNSRGQWGRTALMLASMGGHLDVVRELLKAQPDVNVQDEHGWSALMYASYYGDTDTVGVLLSAGAQVDLQDKHGWSALMRASYSGHTDTVGVLLSAGAQVDLQDKDGWSALMYASYYGHTDTVGVLLSAGAQVDLQEKKHGWSALMRASYSGHTDTVGVLLSAGAQVDLQDKDGWSALMYASYYGHTDTVGVLLSAGAQVDLQEKKHGWSALMRASYSCHTDTVGVLLSAGAQVDLQDKWGRTALMLASEGGHLDVVRELLKAQPDVNVQDEVGWSALMWASCYGDTDTVGVLLSAGAQVDLQNKTGQTALIIAVQSGLTETVSVLVEAGADVNLQEETSGRSAIFYGAEKGELEIVKLLLQGGANLSLKDKDGVTADEVAEVHGHLAVCDELRKHERVRHTPLSKAVRDRVLATGQLLRALFKRLEEKILKTRKKELARRTQDLDPEIPLPSTLGRKGVRDPQGHSQLLEHTDMPKPAH